MKAATSPLRRPLPRIVAGLLALASTAIAADFARYSDRVLWLDNGAVRRAVTLSPEGQVSTVSFRLPGYANNFLLAEGEPTGAGESTGRPMHGPNPAEFSFVADGTTYSGRDAWELVGVTPHTLGAGAGATVALRGKKGAAPLRVELEYLLYPDLPLVRKRLQIVNEGSRPVCLESVDVEVLQPRWNFIHSPAFVNNGRYRHLGPYVGDANDSVVLLRDERSHCGFVLGNEAPAVLKRTAVYAPDWMAFSVGLSHADQASPFRKWLQPGERWASPWTFVALYHDDDPAAPLSTTVATYTRKYLGARVNALPRPPGLIYNTWIPFRTQVNEALVLELADAAAACGADTFVLDDGWANNMGDWTVDRTKFPHGLEPVFARVKALGLKPGLWFTFTTVSRDSDVFRAHPEWLVHGPGGKPVDLASQSTEKKLASVCLASAGWRHHIRDKILALVRAHGLEYVKLDFSMATTAYRFDPAITGCYASGHEHRDRAESFAAIFRGAWELFDELHAAAPGLFIDCTFEAMGGMQLTDLALVQHAEGNSVANFPTDAPLGAIRARQLGWWRTPVVPAASVEIGNYEVDQPDALLAFQSLAGTLPLMCGDPRKIPPEERARLKQWVQWLRGAQDRHHFLPFRQDLPGFGEPGAGRWDGFQRINDETKTGGIVGIFRANAAESTRQVTVAGLAPDVRYDIRRAPDGTHVATATGAELARAGFPVQLDRRHEGALFEISRE